MVENFKPSNFKFLIEATLNSVPQTFSEVRDTSIKIYVIDTHSLYIKEEICRQS